MEEEFLPDWVMATFQELASRPLGHNGRVRLGFAIENLYLPKDVLAAVFAQVRSAGAQLITTHAVHCAMFGGIYPGHHF